MITEPLPGFTNQRPIGKPVSLRRTPEPTGCLCSWKDTYVHFCLMGKNIHATNLRREINRTLFFDRHNNDYYTIAVIYAPVSCWLHASRWLHVFRISVCHPCRGIRTGDLLETGWAWSVGMHSTAPLWLGMAPSLFRWTPCRGIRTLVLLGIPIAFGVLLAFHRFPSFNLKELSERYLTKLDSCAWLSLMPNLSENWNAKNSTTRPAHLPCSISCKV